MDRSGNSPSNSSKTPVTAGTENCPFKLLIVGGGPSGCSVIVRALRLGLLSELCGFTSEEKNDNTGVEEAKGSSSPKSSTMAAGVCLVDAGPRHRFGGGRLQDYMINSNTHVNKFVTHIIEEKPDNLPPEKVKGTALERLGKLFTAQELLKIGPKIGSLKKVGDFLRDVGQTVSTIIQSYPESSRIYHETTVEAIHRCIDVQGKFLYWKVQLKSATNVVVEVYTKHIVLCTGGHQESPVFTNPHYRAKVMLSDHVVTFEGTQELKQRLMKNTSNISGMGRVVIIGGSHSAFSAAWICLHKLIDEELLNLSGTNNNNSNPSRINLMLSTTTPGSPSHRAVVSSTSSNPVTTPTAPNSSTSNPSSSNTPNLNKLRFGPAGICMLHRSAIKVFYGTRADAEHDNYSEYCSYTVNKVTGQINPFGGIRGDAKELWRAIRSARETRIRLLQMKGNIGITTAPNSHNNGSFGGMKQSIVDKVLEEAVVIIWACGYSTNLIPIYDANGKLIPIAHFKGQVNVDEQARILTESSYQFSYHPSYVASEDPSNDTMRCIKTSAVSNTNSSSSNNKASSSCSSTESEKIIPNLYGSGLGYGLRATLENGELDGSSGRADGVAVYLKRSATLVLSHVLGNKVFGGGNIRSWEERNVLLRKQQLMQQQTSHGSASSLFGTTATTLSSSSGPVTTTTSSIVMDGKAGQGGMMLKTLGSPKRPNTTMTAGARSMSTSRRGMQTGRSNEKPIENNSLAQTIKSNFHSNAGSSNNHSNNSNPLNKSCPESFLRSTINTTANQPSTSQSSALAVKKSSNNNNNNQSSLTYSSQTQRRPSTQQTSTSARRPSKEAVTEKLVVAITSDAKNRRPQSAGRRKSSPRLASEAVMSSTAPLSAIKATPEQTMKSPVGKKLVQLTVHPTSPTKESSSGGGNKTPVPTIALSPFSNQTKSSPRIAPSDSNHSPMKVAAPSSTSYSPLYKLDPSSTTAARVSSPNTIKQGMTPTKSPSLLQQSPNPTGLRNLLNSPVLKSPRLPFPALNLVATTTITFDDRKSLV